jgi:hypothetical protein
MKFSELKLDLNIDADCLYGTNLRLQLSKFRVVLNYRHWY